MAGRRGGPRRGGRRRPLVSRDDPGADGRLPLEDEVTRLVDDEIHAVDQMPLIGIVSAPEEIQAGDYGNNKLERTFGHVS